MTEDRRLVTVRAYVADVQVRLTDRHEPVAASVSSSLEASPVALEAVVTTAETVLADQVAVEPTRPQIWWAVMAAADLLPSQPQMAGAVSSPRDCAHR